MAPWRGAARSPTPSVTTIPFRRRPACSRDLARSNGQRSMLIWEPSTSSPALPARSRVRSHCSAGVAQGLPTSRAPRLPRARSCFSLSSCGTHTRLRTIRRQWSCQMHMANHAGLTPRAKTRFAAGTERAAANGSLWRRTRIGVAAWRSSKRSRRRLRRRRRSLRRRRCSRRPLACTASPVVWHVSQILSSPTSSATLSRALKRAPLCVLCARQGRRRSPRVRWKHYARQT